MLFIYIVAVIAWALIWGFATRTVIYNKGYSDNWFWWVLASGVHSHILSGVSNQLLSETCEPMD